VVVTGTVANERDNAQPPTEPLADAGRAGAAAYYVWPLVWVGAAPDNAYASVGQGGSPSDINLDQLADIVVEVDLPQQLRARSLRDGLVVFDFSTWAPYIEAHGMPVDFFELSQLVLRRLALMNAHVACVHTALRHVQDVGHPVTALSPRSILSMNRFDDPQGVGLPDPAIGQIFSARFASTYRPDIPKALDWRIMHRRVVVTTETVDESFRLLAGLLDHASSDRVISLVDLLVRSAAAYGGHDFSQALITAWAVIESLMQEFWERYVERNREREIAGERVSFINAKRKERLTDSANITASIVAEMLSLLDELPMDLFQKLSQVRVARNKWIHDLVPVSAQNADLAVQVAADMLRLVEQLEVDVRQGLALQI
jgi:hypothetical protein